MKTQGLYKGELFSTVWGPVEWVGDQLTGWGGSSQKPNLKINAPCLLKFFDLSDQYRDICKNGVWGPVEWVRDQLTGWGGSSQKQNPKKMHLFF